MNPSDCVASLFYQVSEKVNLSDSLPVTGKEGGRSDIFEMVCELMKK